MLNNCPKDEKVYLDIDYDIYRQILLNEEDNSFAISFNLLKKLDFSNFSFDDVNIRFLDFRGTKGVKIDPQKIYNKDMSYCILEGAEIKGSMDDVLIYYTNFSNTKGININPQTVKAKNLGGCILKDTTITGSFDDVFIRGCNFTGSVGAIVDINKVYQHNIKYTIFDDAKVIGLKNKKTMPNVFSYYDKLDFDEQFVSTKVKILKK